MLRPLAGPTALGAAASDASSAQATFCGYCGAPPADELPRVSRICGRCEMGLLLHADARLAPGAGDAFVVVDERLLVRALSRGAEDLLGTSEPVAVHRPVSELVGGVTADGAPDAPLGRLLAEAAAGELVLAETLVRVGADPHRRRRVLLGPCGPPPAALLVFAAV
jgi:hypothetical protein